MTSKPRDIVKSVRFSLEQWRRAKRAAALETRRQGRTVYATTLVVEVGMDGIDAILAAEAAVESPA